MSKRYKEIAEKLKKGIEEDGSVKVYVPRMADARTALQGAFLTSIASREGIEDYNIDYVTYKEPKIRLGESVEEYNQRVEEYREKMDEVGKDHVILGSEGQFSAVDIYDSVIEAGDNFYPERMRDDFVAKIEAEYLTNGDKSDVSKLIESMNLTNKEVINAKTGFNFWNTQQFMGQMIDNRIELMEDKSFNPTELAASVEEDIYTTRTEIQVEVIEKEGMVALAVPADIAKANGFASMGITDNENVIIAKMDEQDAEKTGFKDMISPVLDDGGQQIYNENGDNMTMDIHKITDAWAKSQINSAMKKPQMFTRGNITFGVIHLDQVGAYYEDVAKIAKDTNIAGYTYEQNDKVIFKPIANSTFELEIPKEWMEGELSNGVDQCNKDGLSVSFRSMNAFRDGVENMLDSMGIERPEIDVTDPDLINEGEYAEPKFSTEPVTEAVEEDTPAPEADEEEEEFDM